MKPLNEQTTVTHNYDGTVTRTVTQTWRSAGELIGHEMGQKDYRAFSLTCDRDGCEAALLTVSDVTDPLGSADGWVQILDSTGALRASYCSAGCATAAGFGVWQHD